MKEITKEIMTLFGMRVKELRKNRGLSQEEAAEKVNISSKYLSRIEMGQHFPSIDTLINLADVLNVELKDFFEFAHEINDPKELKRVMDGILRDVDRDKLKLLVKVARAMVR